MPDPLDSEILTALTGAPRPYNSYQSDSIPQECQLRHVAIEILLPKICATGRYRLRADVNPPISMRFRAPGGIPVARGSFAWLSDGK